MSDKPRKTNMKRENESVDPYEYIRLSSKSDDPCVSIQQLNVNSVDPRESIQQLNINCVDPRESNHLNLKSDDPRESMSLNQNYNNLGYSRKTQNLRNFSFTTSAVGLVELGNVVYRKLCEISPRFAENVSSSMFMYYVSQLHYMRLCCLEWEVTKPDADDLPFMNMIVHNRWIVPQLLADYFSSIGSFRDSAGIPAQHREIVLPCAVEINGITGFYGRVDSTTHAHYENRISPGVAARRIVEDMFITLHPFGHLLEGDWNLPRILVPAEENAFGPTGNLLGWSRATTLTPQQVSVLKDCGVFFDPQKITFSHCTRFCHNNQLMSHISAHLNELKEKVKCVERLSTVPTGSIAQHDFQLVEEIILTRAYVYGDYSTTNCGLAPLYMHQELFAHVFRLRIWRRELPQTNGITLNPWCCYDFNTYKEVPESWCKTSNLYFMAGKLKTWDLVAYKTQPIDLRPLLNALMVKSLIQ